MALQGSIDSFPLADVLRLLDATAKSGRLAVQGDRGTAEVFLTSGALVGGGSSAVPPATGATDLGAVVVDLLRFGDGTFEFHADERCPAPLDPVGVGPLLETARGELDELEELIGRVPSDRHRVVLRSELAADDVRLDRQAWSTVVAVGSGRPVAEVGAALGLGEVAALRAVRDLLDLGVAEVAEPAAVELVPFVPATFEAREPVEALVPVEALEAEPEPEPEPVELVEPVEAAWAPAGGWAVDEAELEGGTEPTLAAPTAPPEVDELVVIDDDDELVIPDGLEELFGDFDPFGPVDELDLDLDGDRAVDPSDEVAEEPADRASAVLAAVAGSAGDGGAGREPSSGSGGPVGPDADAELARQMAVLSPKAAQAVAAAAGVADDPGRAHLVKFLGSV